LGSRCNRRAAVFKTTITSTRRSDEVNRRGIATAFGGPHHKSWRASRHPHSSSASVQEFSSVGRPLDVACIAHRANLAKTLQLTACDWRQAQGGTRMKTLPISRGLASKSRRLTQRPGSRLSMSIELRWSLLKDLERIDCRLSNRGKSDWEVQVARPDGFRCVRHVSTRSRARDFADALRGDLEREGWATPQWPENVKRVDTRTETSRFSEVS